MLYNRFSFEICADCLVTGHAFDDRRKLVLAFLRVLIRASVEDVAQCAEAEAIGRDVAHSTAIGVIVPVNQRLGLL